MALEDHLIGAVRKLREMGESLVDIATKVADEVTKGKPASPEWASAKPEQTSAASSASDCVKSEEIPGWAPCSVQDLPRINGLFRFAAETFQLVGGSVHVRDEQGVLTAMVCSRPLQGNTDHVVYFHPLCKVLAPKK